MSVSKEQYDDVEEWTLAPDGRFVVRGPGGELLLDVNAQTNDVRVKGTAVGAGGGAHPDLATHLGLGLEEAGAYEAAGAVVSHEQAANPHAGYATDADLTTHAAGPHGGSLPAGLIVMWGGLLANIPSGWALCDGQNGTPDLRSRFVKGAAAGADPGATGGSATHTHAGHSDHAALTHAGAAVADHSVTQPSAHTDVPNHTHPITDPGHVHDEYRNSATTGGLDGWGAGDTSTNTPLITGYDTGSKVTGITVDNPAGGVASQPHAGTAVSAHGVTQPNQHAAQAHSDHDAPDSQPPFYALAYIQKL